MTRQPEAWQFGRVAGKRPVVRGACAKLRVDGQPLVQSRRTVFGDTPVKSSKKPRRVDVQDGESRVLAGILFVLPKPSGLGGWYTFPEEDGAPWIRTTNLTRF